MIVIPITNHESKWSTLIFIIQPDNLERMKVGDPISFQSAALGGMLPTISYPNHLYMVIAYEEDLSKVLEFTSAGDYQGLANYLNRGYVFIGGLDGIGMYIPPTAPKKGPDA